MFNGKLRVHTCRVILLTSLVWFLVDVVILSFYSDCQGGACKKAGETDVIISESQVKDYERVDELHQESSRLVDHLLYETVTTDPLGFQPRCAWHI